MTLILGISAYYHDSAAALIKDGKIVSAIQEERLTRIKFDKNFPINSIQHILEEQKIGLKDLEAIVFYEKPFLKFERLLETSISMAPRGFGFFRASMPVWIKEKLFQKNMIMNELKFIEPNFLEISKIKFSEHHLSHAASAFYPSPFDESLIITFDAVGEWTTTSIAIGRNNDIEILEEINFPHSLGMVYSAFTYYLGFEVNSGEYKVMGLAPYGTPKYKDLIINNLFDVKEDGSFKINIKYFAFLDELKMINHKFCKLFGYPKRVPESDIETFHMDIAASIQAAIEEIILKITKSCFKKYKLDNLCLAGGVALNCVANQKIFRQGLFKNIWVQPAAGDAGGALGAALAFHYSKNSKREVDRNDSMRGSLLGPSYKNEEIEKLLDRYGAQYSSYSIDYIIDLVARLLSEQKVIGWFQGKMEYGPRALGNRSILADPSNEKMINNLNSKIKFREGFRPFAPSVLFEDYNDWFEDDIDSPYMGFVSLVKKDFRENNYKNIPKNRIETLNLRNSAVPAVTHVDFSSRIQVVKETINPLFYKLISAFKKKTGIPMLVNTSFNVRGEPIVCTPSDAFQCFMNTNMDILVMGNYILHKDEQKRNLRDFNINER